MKRQSFAILMTLTLLFVLTAASAFAQSSTVLKVTVPFQFSVRGKLLPAGKYTINRESQGFLIIQSADRHLSCVVATIHAQSSRMRDESSLVFNHYGEFYFLSAIRTEGTDSDLQIYQSSAERRLEAATRAANKGAKRQTVSIVAAEPIKKIQQR